MIQKQSFLKVSDNSGARELMCIRVVPGIKKIAISGDIIVAVVKKALPFDNNNDNTAIKIGSKNFVKKSEIVLAVIVRIKNHLNRDNGFFISFDKNSAVLVKSDKLPRGTRIFGPVSKELRKSGFSKVISLAKEIV